MRAFAAAFVVAAAITGTAAAAGPMLPAQSVSVGASSLRVGAHPVALTFTFRYEMQCGDPGTGPVVLQLPAAMSVPSTVTKSTVLLNGSAPSSVVVKGSKITVGIPPRSGVMCDVIGPGTLTVVLERSARIGNPKSAGTYVFELSARPGTSGTAKLRIG
jgi:hypothetical protein